MIKILNYASVSVDEILMRKESEIKVTDVVSEIISNVRKNGDKALFEYCEKFDKAKLDSLEVSEQEIEEAFKSVDGKFIEILKKAAENIYEFHKNQLPLYQELHHNHNHLCYLQIHHMQLDRIIKQQRTKTKILFSLYFLLLMNIYSSAL